MELVALLVGSATLGVSGYVAWHTTWRSGTADVRYVDHNTFPEPGTASGWQARVEVENRGDAVAVNVGVWLGLPTSGDDPPTDIALVPALTPGVACPYSWTFRPRRRTCRSTCGYGGATGAARGCGMRRGYGVVRRGGWWSRRARWGGDALYAPVRCRGVPPPVILGSAAAERLGRPGACLVRARRR
jgi:hypothetical protein